MNDLDVLKTEQILRDYAERNLQKSGKLFCCPACGSGTSGSRNSDGALSIDGNLWKCFSCGAGGSVIDLIMAVEKKDQAGAIKRLRELYDPSYEPNRGTQPAVRSSQPVKSSAALPDPGKPGTYRAEHEEIKRDFRNYFKRCQKNVRNTSYPQSRGLTDETVIRFGLGYDPDWTSPTAAHNRKLENAARAKAGQEPLPPLTPSPRLIIPLSANNYLARDTRPDSQLNDAQRKFKKMNEGKDKPFFNLRAIENPLCFFVVEGEIDAISIEQAGGSCLALGSTVKAKALGSLLKQRDAVKTGTVIISLDNDAAGQKAAEEIIAACEIAGLNYVQANASGTYKDPNEFLVNNRQGFYAAVRELIQQVRAERLAEYEEMNAAHAVNEFMRRPDEAGAAVPTGFKETDKFLDGGLPAGLVFVGGLSSLGKTTLALQMAEYMAADHYDEDGLLTHKGRDVLYFALEQSRNDLLSKMLSRRTYVESIARKNDKLAKTNIELLQWKRRRYWPNDEWQILWKCHEDLKKEVGQRLYIVESPGDMTAVDVEKWTERHVAFTGNAPVVIIDYLQILKSIDEKTTDKQAIDRTITTLKRLSRKYDTTVIGISSFNRENYWQKVSLAAFKDSGNLEYSADVLLAIAPAGMEDAANDKEKGKNRETTENCKDSKDKKLQLHVLKNRNGKTTGKKKQLLFVYHSWHNCFEEEPEESYLSHFDKGNPAALGKTRL